MFANAMQDGKMGTLDALTWKSKSQRSVTLSSLEAEYVALSEAAKEIKFVYQLLQSIGIDIELPITVKVDNIGAIFMSENTSTSGRMKHVDVRYRYVNEMVMDRFLKIKFVKTKENVADIFMKNVSSKMYKKLTPAFLAKKDYLTKDWFTIGRVSEYIVKNQLGNE